MVPLIVGQAPSRGKLGPALGVRSRSGRRLAELLGVEDASRAFETVNAASRWTGKQGKGDRFAPSEEDLIAVRGRMLPGRKVLVLGRAAAKALGVGRARYLDITRAFQAEVMVVPHPSGVNRWWNDPRNVERAKAAVRGWLGEVSRGKEAKKTK